MQLLILLSLKLVLKSLTWSIDPNALCLSEERSKRLVLTKSEMEKLLTPAFCAGCFGRYFTFFIFP